MRWVQHPLSQAGSLHSLHDGLQRTRLPAYGAIDTSTRVRGVRCMTLAKRSGKRQASNQLMGVDWIGTHGLVSLMYNVRAS